MERNSNVDLDKEGITEKKEYTPISKPKIKSRRLKTFNSKQNKAGTKNMIRFKSKKVDPRIVKKKKVGQCLKSI